MELQLQTCAIMKVLTFLNQNSLYQIGICFNLTHTLDGVKLNVSICDKIWDEILTYLQLEYLWG